MSTLPLQIAPMVKIVAGPVWEAQCAGKDVYPSEAAAEAALALIKQDGTMRGRCWLESYECGCCKEWHLGKNRKAKP